MSDPEDEAFKLLELWKRLDAAANPFEQVDEALRLLSINLPTWAAWDEGVAGELKVTERTYTVMHDGDDFPDRLFRLIFNYIRANQGKEPKYILLGQKEYRSLQRMGSPEWLTVAVEGTDMIPKFRGIRIIEVRLESFTDVVG